MNTIPIHLPEAESAAAGAEIIQWHVAPGRSARTGEVLVSLDAGESVIEIAAPCDGVLSRILAEEGDWLEPGALLAEFAPGAAFREAPASEPPPGEALEPLRGSAMVRRIARELRLELEAIHGIEGDRLPEATPVQRASARGEAAAVIIETAINGVTQPARNPHVPVTATAIAAEALACLEAGAAIVHTHTPLSDFSLPATEAAERYLESYRPVLAARPDALLYPTIGAGATMADRLAHIEILARRGAIRIGLMDPGTMILGWAEPDGTPSTASYLYVNTYADMAVALAQAGTLGLGLSLAIYEPGFLRNALAWWKLGRIPPGAMLKFYFGGEAGYMGIGRGVSFGLPPTAKALEAYLEMLEIAGCPLPWSVAVMGGDLFATPIARLALERGGHLHTGLEDHLGPDHPTNEELTRLAVALCREVGRPVASCSEAAAILDLPPQVAVPGP